jgi:predicted secreted protein
MAAQNGKDLLIKVDMTSDGQFETIAGLGPHGSVSTRNPLI